MKKLTKIEMVEKLASEVENYDLETLIECAKNHEKDYWLRQSISEVRRVYEDRFETESQD